MDKKLEAFGRLLTIMDELREQCPWDKKQTMQSLRHLTIEETYELTDAIFKNDLPEVKKELGDVLLHIVFYARIASETNAFDIADVIHSLCEKLISRHPHIYGDVKVADEEEVKQNWEKLKLKEGNKSVFGGVPSSLPSVIKALRIQDKAAQVGFDWPDTQQVWDKVDEEMAELKETITEQQELIKTEEELGDLMFALVNLSRHLNINPDDALERTNQKFIQRFQFIEEKCREQGKKITDINLLEMELLWQLAKTK
ncbi:MAG: nucleoside triphosphate pyrophosphohydrolase [Bacteroidia bacterium]|nr:nucleoside triphosphate pyrophosphohydrolase [Bacteroidia bacterium]MBP7261765.1 nucleoside triphosphate pyrophosphohydrolase [Bacteroidia bacterium]MBP9180938.1 nucleoside triphosphate pyrophosphohydrolase [Bacteroidia bacterium]MBP9725772.1 nucleoside triphosphate pyrophosphohydrolase [Bacteroidia bacterium]